MRTAILALCVSLGLLGILAIGSLFGYDLKPDARKAMVTTSTESIAQEQPAGISGRQPQAVEVPSGTFTGPTEQPSVRGPSGPPPQD